MNCLTYLLDLWENGDRFKIYYDGDHCCGVNNNNLFDFNGGFKKSMLEGNADMYLLLEICHSVDNTIKIFNLDEHYSKLIEDYYERT